MPSTKPADWVGQTLSRGRYEIKAKLGEGGMGCVYRARDRKLDSDVIIKVPRPALLLDPEFVARFTREVRALVQLEHPNIVRVMDVDKHIDAPFAVMQFLGGGSLEDRQTRGADATVKPMPVDQLRSWLPQVAAALDFVHQQGFIHRDVKPANILFDQRGHVYLSDFGVAKAVTETGAAASLTGTGVVLGTPAYMAPEMALGKSFDGRIDQYALAVTVYELLAGRWPFEGPTPSAILLKQTSEAPPRLDDLNPRIRGAVADVVQQALAKDPAKRFPNCAAFAQAAIRASQGRVSPQTTAKAPTVATQPLVFDPPSRPRTVSRAQFLALGLLALVLVGGLAAVLVIRQALIVPPVNQAARLSLSAEAVLLTPGKNYQVEVRVNRAGHEGPIEVEVLNLPPRVSYSMPRIPADWSTGQLELVTAGAAPPKEQTATIRARIGSTVLEQPLRVSIREIPAEMRDDEPPPQPPANRVTGPSQPNSIGMHFMTLPSGEYVRGSPADDPDADQNERPQQRVRLTKPFEMAIHEVTVGQFRKFVEATGHQTDAESSGEGSDGFDTSTSEFVQGPLPRFNWRNVGWTQTDNHPVVSTSYNDAKAFCTWLSQKEGRAYRLPTEAEWEYAARAGTTTRYWTGDSVASLEGAENFADVSLQKRWPKAMYEAAWDDGHPFTAPVGSFKPNPWGLFDMLGNAAERASDRYDPDSYKQPSVTDPTGGKTGPPIFRGVSWRVGADSARAAIRWGELPASYRNSTAGFRVVREVK